MIGISEKEYVRDKACNNGLFKWAARLLAASAAMSAALGALYAAESVKHGRLSSAEADVGAKLASLEHEERAMAAMEKAAEEVAYFRGKLGGVFYPKGLMMSLSAAAIPDVCLKSVRLYAGDTPRNLLEKTPPLLPEMELDDGELVLETVFFARNRRSAEDYASLLADSAGRFYASHVSAKCEALVMTGEKEAPEGVCEIYRAAFRITRNSGGQNE